MKHLRLKVAIASFFIFFFIRFGWAWVCGGLMLLFGKDNRALQAIGLGLVAFSVIASIIESVKNYISMGKVMDSNNPLSALFAAGKFSGDPSMYENIDFDAEIEKTTSEIFEMPEALSGRRCVERLREELKEASTIEECVSAFEKECMDQLDPDEMIMFECGNYPWNKGQFSFSLTRQYPDGVDDEFFQVKLDILFEADETNEKLFESAWNERLKENIFDYIRRSKSYHYAQENKFSKIRIYMSQT